MKKWIVFTTLLISACAPQVTVTSEVTVTSMPLPTETPIPTPTLYPAFVEIQEKIENAGTRFNLNSAEGVIYDGQEPVPGLRITMEGKLTLTIDGKNIPIDIENINFDVSKGLEIDGYELYNGKKWVLNPEMQAVEDMKLFGKTLEDFVISTTEDGAYILQDKVSEDVVYKERHWEISYVRKLISESGNCKYMQDVGERIGPSRATAEVDKQISSPLLKYYMSAVENGTIQTQGRFFTTHYFGNHCWGGSPKFSIAITYVQTESLLFWKDNQGKPEYVYVFINSEDK